MWSFFGLTSKVSALALIGNFDADVKKSTARHQLMGKPLDADVHVSRHAGVEDDGAEWEWDGDAVPEACPLRVRHLCRLANKDGETPLHLAAMAGVRACVYVCMCERDRERGGERGREREREGE